MIFSSGIQRRSGNTGVGIRLARALDWITVEEFEIVLDRSRELFEVVKRVSKVREHSLELWNKHNIILNSLHSRGSGAKDIIIDKKMKCSIIPH